MMPHRCLSKPLFLLISCLLLGGSWQAVASELTSLVDNHKKTVVNIRVIGQQEETDDADEPSSEGQEPESAQGSGFIISADGYVMTNAHVVKEAEKILVGLHDRRELPAQLIGSDPKSDIALLKIAADNLPTVQIGDADALKVGQWVVAIGAPFGFEYSATQGIVSALSRSLPDETYIPFIQTDVAVNPGNSGGPLFNLQGEVVGINSQIYSRTGGYMGLSFAIPINMAMYVTAQLKTQGKVSRGWLGVLIQNVNYELARSFGLEKPSGALVAKVTPNGPAAKAGIQAGDIILMFNQKAIELYSELPRYVGITPVGSDSQLQILRQGKTQMLAVKIEELPAEAEADHTSPSQSRLKLVVKEPTDKQRKIAGHSQGGVVIEQVLQSRITHGKLRAGDILAKIDHQTINDLSHFETLVEALPSGKPIALLVMREHNPFFMTLKLAAE
jgi:serine protease Do